MMQSRELVERYNAAWNARNVDALVAFPHAASVGAISHMATQWYVPVLAGPLLVVCHVACFVLLVRGGGGAGGGGGSGRR